MKTLVCPLCRDTGRIRTIGFGPHHHAQVRPCPACPPSETVNEALERAAAREQRP